MKVNIPKMILFDYGGTLLCEPDWDSLRGERAVLEHAASNPRGITPEVLAAWEHERILSPATQAMRALGAEQTMVQFLRLKYELHGIGLDVPYEEAEYILWSNSSLMSERCVYPHIRETLDALEERGIHTGVISNLVWSGRSLKRRIDALLPNNRFAFVLTSSDYGIRKPDVRLFQTALAKAGLAAEDVWYCGNDYGKDIQASRAAGLFPVWYLGRMEGDRKEPPSVPVSPADCVSIADWAELPELLDRLTGAPPSSAPISGCRRD